MPSLRNVNMEVFGTTIDPDGYEFGEVWVDVQHDLPNIPDGIYDYQVLIKNRVLPANLLPDLTKMLELRDINHTTGKADIYFTVTGSFELHPGIYGPYNKQCTGCIKHGKGPKSLVFRILEAIFGIKLVELFLRCFRKS